MGSSIFHPPAPDQLRHFLIGVKWAHICWSLVYRLLPVLFITSFLPYHWWDVVSSCFYPFIWVIQCCCWTGLLCGWGGARQVFVLMLHTWPALKIVLSGFVFIAHPAADPSRHLASFLLHCESYYLTRSAYISCVNQIWIYLVWWSASWMADEYSVMSAMLWAKRFTFFMVFFLEETIALRTKVMRHF